MVFIYDGRWSEGSKAQYRFVGQALASQGFVAVIADYRLYPEVRFPTFIEDSAKAVRWILAHIGQYGGNTGCVYLMGHSASAYIAAILTLDERYLRTANAPPDSVCSMIGLAGPYDFLPLTAPTSRTSSCQRRISRARSQFISWTEASPFTADSRHG